MTGYVLSSDKFGALNRSLHARHPPKILHVAAIQLYFFLDTDGFLTETDG